MLVIYVGVCTDQITNFRKKKKTRGLSVFGKAFPSVALFQLGNVFSRVLTRYWGILHKSYTIS